MPRPTLQLRAALKVVAAFVAMAWMVPCSSLGTLPQARAAAVAGARAESPRPPHSDAQWRRFAVESNDAEDRDGLDDDDDDELDELRNQVPALLSVVLVPSRPVRQVPTRYEPDGNSPGSRRGPPPRMPPA